jgi:hypothetical protein
MFVERYVSYSALFTYLVRWHAGVVSLPPAEIIFAQLACPLNDVIFCLHQEERTFLSTNIVAISALNLVNLCCAT